MVGVRVMVRVGVMVRVATVWARRGGDMMGG